MRYAKINLRNSDTADTVKAYLPGNYEIDHVDTDYVIIKGEDNCGWTLDEYVLPRLASGLIFGRELVAEEF